MKYIYMVNRFVLKDRSDDVISRLRKASDRCARTFEIVENNNAKEAKAAAGRYRDRECVVTTIGGDGSVNALLNDLMGGRAVMAFLPFGTGNDMWRTCTETLEDGLHELDVIRINDRYFINAACFGIDADIANDDRFIHNRMIPGPLRYHAGVLHHFLTWRRGRKLKIVWDGGTVEREFTTVVAANARYYGGGYKISPDSVVDDGMMEVYLVDRLGKVNMARTILSMKNAGHLKNPALQMIRTEKCVISCGQEITANIDGEPLPGKQFELELIPHGIRVDLDRKFVSLLEL